MTARWGVWAGAISLVLGFAGAAFAQDKVVNIYNWTDYIGPNVIPGFEKATGIKVNYDTYDQNETLEAKLSAGKSGYDVAVPTFTPFLARGAKAGLYQKLDKSLLKNWGNLDPEILALMAKSDPGNQYAVPWIVATDGIAVNVEKVKEIMPDAPLDSYDLIFKPDILAKFKDCGVEMIDSPTDELPVILNWLKLDPNSEKPEDLKRAADVMTLIRPYIRKFESSGYINDLANGDLCIAFGYSTDIKIAAKRAKEAGKPFTIRYIIPKEGTLLYLDALAIPADAPHVAEAHAFIDYVLKPDVMADTANTVGGRSGNAAALPFIAPEVAKDPTVYPPPEVRKSFFVLTVPSRETEKLRTRLWTKIKTGH
ncbi:MAG TPA: polyamine ABC transporter substrate-binding protein [Rhodoblastus sp.]|nr:polyamine ABC transporter substrate-binding protein [Rhodoblastus sp.]